MGFKTFRDRLGLILIFLIPGLWIASAYLPIAKEAMGASILAWGLIVQFYFRKSGQA
jgi:hypothetical protein